MLARHPIQEQKPRRGIVLVLILGMLALLALIGVTFASIASQAQTGSKKFAESLLVPDAKQMFDFGLSQLINDTTNPLSALHGHSLLRDMYGNDAATNGHITSLPDGTPLRLTGFDAATGRYSTNIPQAVLSYGFDPRFWTLRLNPYQIPTGPNAGYYVASSFEIQSFGVVSGRIWFTLASGLDIPFLAKLSDAIVPNLNITFTLDSRYQRAFNGAGVTSLAMANNNDLLRMPNFLYNGLAQNLANNGIALDEDYDACDLENMYLALESADGSVVIPSFHRPGLIRHDVAAGIDDWTAFPLSQPVPPPQQALAQMSRARFLRPRPVDHPTSGLRELRPDPNTGKIEYDIDNDGDGTTDSVWLDLGFPAQRDANGKLYKPMFAFKVIGLNGKLPLNTAGNLQARSLDDVDADGLPDNTRLWDHASHLGYSVNEINPKYALQNGGGPQFDNAPMANGFGGTGIPVNLTQLRNILAGTRPQPNASQPSPLNQDANAVNVAGQPIFMPNNIPDSVDGDSNGLVLRNVPAVPGLWGEERGVPQQILRDVATSEGDPNNNIPPRPYLTYYGRVGPGRSPVLSSYNTTVTPPIGVYNYDNDGMSDDYAGYDFFPNTNPAAQRNNPLLSIFGEAANLTDATGAPVLPAERFRLFVNPIDISGNGLIQRWFTPPTTTTVNFTGGYGGIATNGGTMGYGPDQWGRVSFFNYYRPPGVPAYTDPSSGLPIIPDANNNNLADDPIGGSRHNLYHGYEAARAPRFASTVSDLSRARAGAEAFMAPMPYNRTNNALAASNYWPDRPFDPNDPTSPRFPTQLIDAAGTFIGSFDGTINSFDSFKWTSYLPSNGPPHPVIYGSVPNAYPGGGLGRDLAHEVNQYRPTPLDAPYGPADLEWLYRQQDVDGDALQSRLAQLAPVSFVHSPDALTRRRLFSIETWDLNTFSWAYDNPANVFPNNNLFGLPAVSYVTPGSGNIIDLNAARTTLVNAGLATPTLAETWTTSPPPTHKGRKINLNQPFPVTNRHDEPVRQKWVLETYQALKQILPPKAVDTPEELLDLTQYVLNIVDFRDTDAAMTLFFNPDVRITNPVLGGPGVDPEYPQLLMRWVWDSVNGQYIDRQATNDPAWLAARPVEQFGMEFNPLALNEVLAYRYNARNPTGGGSLPIARLWIELVNTLTRAATDNGTHNASDVLPDGWEIAILPDDSWGRPNPFTGQINPNQPDRKGNPADNAARDVPWPKVQDMTGMPPVRAMRVDADSRADDSINNRPYYYVIGPHGLRDNNNREYDPRLFEAGMPLTRPIDANDSPPASQAWPGYVGPDPGEYNPPNGNVENAELSPDENGNLNPIPPRSVVDAQLSDKTLFEADDDNDNTADATPGAYYWVYLRRPANPLDPSSPKVVVDSIRIPYTVNPTLGQDVNNEVELTAGTTLPVPNTTPTQNKRVVQPAGNRQAFYSFCRFEPYRGSHLIPPLPAPGQTNPPPGVADYRYGVSEAHFYSYDNDPDDGYGIGLYSRQVMTQPVSNSNPQLYQVPTTNRIYHNLGRANTSGNSREDWRHFPFHDRDFMSVYELTQVPACPPGLFTKQFVESPPNPFVAPTFTSPDTRTNRDFPYRQTSLPRVIPNGSPFEGSRLGGSTIPVFPYLSDNFFYSAEGSTITVDNSPPNPTATPPVVGPVVGGATGAGWYKMFELFEVPSSAFGAIGPVAQGQNFDWFREDRRPGQINLNLIIDEEVFHGLLDDETVPKLNGSYMSVENNVPAYPGPFTNLPSNHPVLTIPRVVTQVDARGYPTYEIDPGSGNMRWTGSYPMQNRGFDDIAGGGTDPISGQTVMPMKVAFADFLKLRHGGSGFLFTHALGQTGSGPVGPVPDDPTQTTSPAMERPFRSASFPDINFTVLRPATLPPSPFTVSAIVPPPTQTLPFPAPQDPSLKRLATRDNSVLDFFPPRPSNPTTAAFADRRDWLPAPIPPRRLFQIPDTPAGVDQQGETTFRSNATETGDSRLNLVNMNLEAQAGTYIPIAHPTLFNPAADLVQTTTQGQPNPLLLGGYRNVTDPNNNNQPVDDRRQHPVYRTEWMQKVMNLTTVRTHQYAVWVTVGFFEVVRSGDPARRIPDELGPEIGASSGQNVRYRGFFILDRTRATGFDPFNPADFRQVVVYSRRIE